MEKDKLILSRNRVYAHVSRWFFSIETVASRTDRRGRFKPSPN